MKQTSKQKRPQKIRSKIRYSTIQTAPKSWMIYFHHRDKLVCGVTKEGDVEWAMNATMNEGKRCWESFITLGTEAVAGVKKGARRRMVLQSFKHMRYKAKNLNKKELIKYINTTINRLEKKETLRILQGKD